MKKLFVVLMLLLLTLSLGACGKKDGNEEENVVEDIKSSHADVKNYVKYLEAAESNDLEDIEYSYYNYEDNDYYVYIDNYSDTLFYRTYVSLYETEDSTEVLYEDKDYYYLIRPMDYAILYAQADKTPGFCLLDKVEAYTLNYEKDLEYDWYYDEDEDDIYCFDIVYDGTLSDDLVERILKKEYIINVLVDMYEDYFYLLDSNTTEYNEEQLPVVANAQYTASIDYEERTIQIFKDGVELKTITMD